MNGEERSTRKSLNNSTEKKRRRIEKPADPLDSKEASSEPNWQDSITIALRELLEAYSSYGFLCICISIYTYNVYLSISIPIYTLYADR